MLMPQCDCRMAFALQVILKGLSGCDGVAIPLLGQHLVPFLEPLYGVQVGSCLASWPAV